MCCGTRLSELQKNIERSKLIGQSPSSTVHNHAGLPLIFTDNDSNTLLPRYVVFLVACLSQSLSVCVCVTVYLSLELSVTLVICQSGR